MPRIQQLSASVVNKIAAGEVIERPASVVKELLENSLDALSTRIEVDVVAGGTELIRIVDDGEGIHPDDLLLAVTSHATSKITSADDLFDVQTMGFRGEAMASVAEVSRMRVRSRQENQSHGMELTVDLGKVDGPRPCGCPFGTQIEIRSLFENTPVRRKFLKTISTEFGHVTEQFSRIALANPRLHMVLRHNDKIVHELPATDRPLDRIRLFFGGDLAEELIPVESEQAGTRMWGYVGHPKQSKSTRKQQYLFLNGRWIQDRSLQHALTESYRGLLMVGRQPVAFLFIELPPDRVDVNVHPTKVEVRFRDSQQLFRQLLSMIRSKFLSMDIQAELRLPNASSQPGGSLSGFAVPPAQNNPQRELASEFADWSINRINGQTGSVAPFKPFPGELPRISSPFADSPRAGDDVTEPGLQSGREAGVPAPQSTVNAMSGELYSDQSVSSSVDAGADAGSAPAPSADAVSSASWPESRAMQIHDCYLVVETPEGMTVIDQHALHERIVYEHLRTRVLAGAVESQRLLVPQPIELNGTEAALLLEQSEAFDRAGLGLEDFGNGTVLVTRYPAMLRKVDLNELVRDLLAKLDGGGAAGVQTSARRDILDELLHMMSCKAAVKAGQRLSPEEIESLLQQRHLVDDAHHCPHGRPTALSLSRMELDRQFGRLG
ncbi:MAG: DNA mismatch repair endonuclease MutL [Planctomycetes bacterium]|nr:DNA mismatch repair endonuclease MutL [Planctomycetota bacterium]